MKQLSKSRFGLLAAIFLVLGTFMGYFGYVPAAAHAAEDSQFFPETNHTVSGKFLDYWRNNGGLPVYGYPITDAQMEVDPETGKTFLTQWFERNRFELHPENAGTRFEVLLGLLGKDLRREALAVDPDFAVAGALVDPTKPKDQQWYFSETGHNLRYRFLQYWLQNGGLERFGYPISEEGPEIDPETGKVFTTQWFERARFEYHPENQAPYDVLLGLLGNQIKNPKGKADFVWKLGGEGYAGFFRASSLTVSGNKLYLTDSLNNRVLVYNTDSGSARVGPILEKWGSWGSGDGQFEFGTGSSIAVDGQGNVFVVDGYHRVQKFDKDGHFLLTWGSFGSNQGQFDRPRQIGVDSQGNVYVADEANNRVEKFDNNGGFLQAFGSFGDGQGQLRSPVGLTIDSAGNIYVVNSVGGKITKFDREGHYLTSWLSLGNPPGSVQNPPLNPSLKLATDRQDNIYLLDSFSSHVVRFDANGKVLYMLGVFGGDDTVGWNSGIAVEPGGDIYVSNFYNFTVDRYHYNGDFITSLGPTPNGNGRFNPDYYGGPSGVALNRQANLYVADMGNHRIQKFSGNGVFQFSFGSQGIGDGQFGYDPGTPGLPLGIAIDGLGYIYVADSANYRIQKFDSNGKFITKWGSKGSGDGQFSDFYTQGPGGLAVDGQGNVYVADYGNSRIQKFDSNGKFLTKWGSVGGLDGQFANPNAVAVDAQGNVFVADDFRIQKFDSNGKFLAKFGNGGKGLVVDSQGRLLVAGTSNGAIWVFDNTGNYQFEWGGQGHADGQFTFANGIAVDVSGNVYVADTRNNRIQKFHLR